jgi:uncharacterized protein with NAD-binding domain and iron-sulfur cluster
VSDERVRIAIVGGGCAGMTAAFELTRPELRGRYDVTVYQVGWRLGGKGASGRGPAGRIEEHGLHLWMGFYDNAFGLMRDCYAELGRDPARCPIAGWQDAFTPAPFVGVADRAADGTWVPWMAHLPATPGLPGDPHPGGARWSAGDYLVRSAMLVRTLFESLQGTPPDGAGIPAGPSAVDDLVARAGRLVRYGELASMAALIHAVTLVEAMLRVLPAIPDTLLQQVLDAVTTGARTQMEARARHDPDVRRLWTVADLTLATMRGMLRFGLLTDPRGFDAIDDYDCREWLVLNGATAASVDGGYLRGLYDLGFSYEDADPARPRISAAQALRSMLRAFFTYRGSFFWRMEAGMGDVVFAPLYEVLSRRGVRFEFFHRLENVGMRWDGAQPHVETLAFDVQAHVAGGGAYRPLVDVGGLPCWPSAPDWTQLAGGQRLAREQVQFESFWDRRRVATNTLRVGADFDLVVLAVGGGAIPHVCAEIVARDARWRTMVERVKTVATQAFQVWLRADMAALGWRHPPVDLSGFVEPFDTWADMRHLLPRERWRIPPEALAYFCNVLPDGARPADRADAAHAAAARERVRENAVRFLERDVAHLWPRALDARGRFRWELLAAPDDAERPAPGSADAARFATQYWTANVNPSDRYSLSLPGTSRLRISPLDGTYDNLTVAGDWTACGFVAGCVEAAVMSGRLAAHAIALSPPLEDIVGYDHP